MIDYGSIGTLSFILTVVNQNKE